MSDIGNRAPHGAADAAAREQGTSPKVSVLMAVCNGARFLREAVDSVLGQTLADLELIVVDDASTDDTPAILDSYGDPRLVRLRKERNVGPYRARNWALPRCRGQYIAPMDADDVSMPTRLEKQARYLDEHPEVVLVSANMEVTDEAGRHLDQTDSAGDPEAIAWELLFYNRGAGDVQARHAPEDRRISREPPLQPGLRPVAEHAGAGPGRGAAGRAPEVPASRIERRRA